MCVHSEETVRCRHAELLLVVGVPLPLQSECGRVKLVALYGVDDGYRRCRLWLAVNADGLAAEVAVAVNAHHRPSLGPCHGIEMNDTSISTFILEMQKPVFTLAGVDPSALMRPVDIGVALSHDGFALVWSVGTLGTHGELPSGSHAASGTHYPIVTVVLIELRTFGGMVFVVAVEDNDGLANGASAIGTEFPHGEHAFELSSAAGPSVDKIASSVVVPQWSGVDHSFSLDHAYWCVPSASGILGFYHEHTTVRIAPVDIIITIVISYAWSPDTTAVLWSVIVGQ